MNTECIVEQAWESFEAGRLAGRDPKVEFRSALRQALATADSLPTMISALPWQQVGDVSKDTRWTAGTEYGVYEVAWDDGWYSTFEPDTSWEWSGDRVLSLRTEAFEAAEARHGAIIGSSLEAHPVVDLKVAGDIVAQWRMQRHSLDPDYTDFCDRTIEVFRKLMAAARPASPQDGERK
jgi:hypothetical protein